MAEEWDVEAEQGRVTECGRGARHGTQERSESWQSCLPEHSMPISTLTANFMKPLVFCPMREPGPHLDQHPCSRAMPLGCISFSCSVMMW